MAGRSRVEVKGQYIAYLAKSSEEMASQIAGTGELHVWSINPMYGATMLM